VQGSVSINEAIVVSDTMYVDGNLTVSGGSELYVYLPQNAQGYALEVDGNVSINEAIVVSDTMYVEGNLTVSGSSELYVYLPQNAQGYALKVDGDVLIDDAEVDSHSMFVQGSTGIDDGALICPQVTVHGDLRLENNAVLTVPAANSYSYELIDPVQILHLTVDNTLFIHTGAAVDLTGKGYPSGVTWEDAPNYHLNNNKGASHAGIGAIVASRFSVIQAYGDYRSAQWPGGGSNAGSDGAGGGVVQMQVGTLDMDNGSILANSSDNFQAAGGSISISAQTLRQSGVEENNRIQANGGSGSQIGGGGGRVVLRYTTNDDFNTNQITAHGGTSTNANFNHGGAGTILILPDTDAGHLKVSNYDPAKDQLFTSNRRTPAQVIGQRTISQVEYLTGNRWAIEVDSPMPADKGYIGYYLDLDASDPAGPYYPIVDFQGDRQFIVSAPDGDDLTSVQLNTLTGVHILDTIEVLGAKLDFGEDLLVLNNIEGSSVGRESEVHITKPENSTIEKIAKSALQGLWVIDDDLSLQESLTVESAGFAVNNLHIEQNLNLNTGSRILTGTLDVGGSITSKGGTIVAPLITVDKNLNLTDQSMVTVPDATQGAFYPLTLEIEKNLSILGGSSIDVSGKGYIAGQTTGHTPYANSVGGSHGSQGGTRSGLDPMPAYGDYRHPQDAGSSGGGTNNFPGGGSVYIQAAGLLLDGSSIKANGTSIVGYNRSAYNGAGGSIAIDVGLLQITASEDSMSRIEANAGEVLQLATYGAYGSGGRISILYEEVISVDWSGVTALGAGWQQKDSSTNTSYIENGGGAGTIWLKPDGLPGTLKVSNRNPDDGLFTLSEQTTPLQVVGRHEIIGVALLPDTVDQWEVTLADDLDGDKTYIGYQVDLDGEDALGPYYDIVRVPASNRIVVQSDINLAEQGLTGKSLTGVHHLQSLVVHAAQVDFGADMVLIDDVTEDDPVTEVDIKSSVRVDRVHNELLKGLAGYGMPGKWIIDAAFVHDELTVGAVDLTVNSLELSGGMTLGSGGRFTAGALDVGGNLEVDEAVLVCPLVDVQGNFTLKNNAVATVPPADDTQWHALRIEVDDTMSILDGAAVDVSAKGYPPGKTWDNSDHGYTYTGGSHGGYGGSYSGAGLDPIPVYGDFRHPRYPGSGGRYKTGNTYIGKNPGGGVVHINAEILELNEGAILSKGIIDETVYSSNTTGAGGSIDIHVVTLMQSGTENNNRIAANGGGIVGQKNSWTGGGGRVAIFYTVNDGFDWDQVSAHGGDSSTNVGGTEKGGAGTICLQKSDGYADIKISNIDLINTSTISSNAPTEMEVVGRQTINGVQPYGDDTDRWLVTIQDPLLPDRDYTGYWIDLDASDNLDPLDEIIYEITGTMGANQLIIETTDDLESAGLEGKELIGVHMLNTLTVQGGGTADFGEDRVIVTDGENSLWDADSSIISGTGSVLPDQQE
jgi:hypothetical protein